MLVADDSGVTRQRVLLAVAIVALAAAGVVAWHYFPRGPDTTIASRRPFKCAECNAVFPHDLELGETEPINCPKCGKKTAWIPEACYWTKDGKAKAEPTWVIVKERMGLEGKTYCPDCGKEVVGHNRMPSKELMDAAKAGGKK